MCKDEKRQPSDGKLKQTLTVLLPNLEKEVLKDW